MKSEPRPEWLRPKEVPMHFGIGRSKFYEILATGKVRTVSLRKRGQKHGTRLVSYDSLSAYLESIAEGGDAVERHSTREDADADPKAYDGDPTHNEKS